MDIPGYRILEKIGEGEFREVYRAEKSLELESSEGGRILRTYPRALKIIKTVEHSPVGFAELEALQGLNHPSLERLYHFGSVDGKLFTETELIDGQPLLEKIFEKKTRRITRTLSPKEAVYIALRIAEGLEYLHAQGYVARDLSLTNIMVNDDLSSVKICDIGNIKKIGEEIKPESRPDGKNLLFGLDYLPPEIRANLRGIASQETDAYALGAALLYMLVSKEGDTLDYPDINFSRLNSHSKEEYERGLEERIIRAYLLNSEWLEEKEHLILKKAIYSFPDFSEVGEEDDGTIDYLLRRSLSFDPEKRFKSVEEFRRVAQAIEATFRLAHSYTGKNVLVRLSHGSFGDQFVYGRLRRVKREKLDTVYVFDKALTLFPDYFNDEILQSIQHGPEVSELGNVLIELARKGVAHSTDLPQGTCLVESSRTEIQTVCEKIMKDGVEHLEMFPSLRGSDVLNIISFDFGDDVKIFIDTVEESKMVKVSNRLEEIGKQT